MQISKNKKSYRAKKVLLLMLKILLYILLPPMHNQTPSQPFFGMFISLDVTQRGSLLTEAIFLVFADGISFLPSANTRKRASASREPTGANSCERDSYNTSQKLLELPLSTLSKRKKMVRLTIQVEKKKKQSFRIVRILRGAAANQPHSQCPGTREERRNERP